MSVVVVGGFTMLSALFKKRVVSIARVCLRCHSTSPGPNEELIQALSRYMEDEKKSASVNSYKVRAYTKAIAAIGQLPDQVKSVEQVRHLEGIGTRIAKRIDAYLSGTPYEPPASTTSKKVKIADYPLTKPAKPKLRKTLDQLRREMVISSLSSVSGIGPSKASTLYDAGCRSLQDLKDPEFFQMLSRPQQINVRYMIGSERLVTREQASIFRDFVEQNISSRHTVLLCGDFRRGANSAQHITLLILHPQSAGVFPPAGSPNIDSTIKQRSKYDIIPTPFTSYAETKVKAKGLPHLTTFSTEIMSPLECRGLLAPTTITAGAQKWNGIIRVPERSRNEAEGNGWESRAERIEAVEKCEGQFFSAEIYYVPHQCAGAALITLTGDAQFNVAVRKAASQLGFRLNEYGLWKWQESTQVSGVDAEKQSSIEQYGGWWELIASEKEEDILHAVGMEWVAPERRNFANLNARSRVPKTKEGL